MSDLISRKAVLAYIREQHDRIIIEQNKYSDLSHDTLNGMKTANEDFNDFIMMIPTAYDVERISEDLEELLVDIVTIGDATAIHHWNRAVMKGIDIVKGGGRDE